MKTNTVTATDVLEKAVIYARYSSSGQREESIDGQLRECRAYAEKLGMIVVGEYCDSAMSGTNDRRPQFQRMIKDSAKGQFTTVIMWKIDRFARNKYDSATYKYRLRQNGVRLIYAKESIPDGPEGIILESLLEGMAEYYSANLSENVKRGNYDSALKRQTLGHLTYGLRTAPNGTFEKDPATAPIVARIFEEYINGKSAKNICNDLNNEGYRTLKGGLFNKNSIRRIVSNEKYCGIYRYQDICYDDGIPAIVSKDAFKKASEMLKIHSEKPALKKENGGFLLTGKLFCGECNEAMVGDSGTSRGGTVYYYYTCKNMRAGKCHKRRESRDVIEDIIVGKLSSLAADEAFIQRVADRFMIWQEKQDDKSELKALQSRLNEVEKAIAGNLKLVDAGIITDSIKSHLVELESQRVDLERGISIAKMSAPKVTRAQIVHFIRQFAKCDISDIRWRIFIVETFLSAAWVFDDGRIVMQLNYDGNNNRVSYERMIDISSRKGISNRSSFASSGAPNDAKTNLEFEIFEDGVLIVVIQKKRV